VSLSRWWRLGTVRRGVLYGALVASVAGTAGGAAITARARMGRLPARAAARRAQLPALRARLTFAAGSRPIPPEFLGLSVEDSEIGHYERSGRPVDRVFALIHRATTARCCSALEAPPLIMRGGRRLAGGPRVECSRSGSHG
jgi:hypothetical protein